MYLAQSMAILLQAKWLAEAISGLFAGSTLQEQSEVIALFLLAFVARHGIGAMQQGIAQRFAEQTGTSLRNQLLKELFQKGPVFARTEGTGNLVTLVLEGIGKFRKYAELIVPRMLSVAITPALVWLYVFMTDRISAVILLVTMPILIVFLILVGLAAKKQTEGQLESYQMLSNHFVDSLRGLITLKFLGQSRKHMGSIRQVSEGYRRATMRTLRVAFLSSFALDFFTMLSVASVAVNLGLRLINGSLELLPALLVLILAPEFFLPVRMVGADFHATLDGKQAGESMLRMIHDARSGEGIAEHQEEPQEAESAGKSFASPFEWSERSELQLTGIGMKHDPQGPASLEDVSFRIPGRGKVGIVGASGAGKSTLIDILGGFTAPTRGDVRLNGVRLEHANRAAWRSKVTYMPQNPYIFSGTLEENIRFYAPEAAPSEVEAAVVAAGLSELARELPHGLQERIGGGGRALSGGQAQRVALARVLLGKRQVLLLDEPTAHLDIETECELKETMLSLFQDKWVFLATHRLHWMRDMDLIIVMQQGRVVETGTHKELVELRGMYYRMITSQWEGAR